MPRVATPIRAPMHRDRDERLGAGLVQTYRLIFTVNAQSSILYTFCTVTVITEI